MQIDDTLLTRLEKLSYLKIDDAKRQEVIEQLSEIVGFVENLSELDTEGVDANFSMDERATPLREDEPTCNTEVSDAILEHAPKSQDHFFIVPKIIE